MQSVKWVVIAVMMMFAIGCSSMGTPAVETNMKESGYFLSMKQKGQLIGKGQIEDSEGIWYDVWIVPGYVGPAKRVKTYVGKAGESFAEYGQAKKYQSLLKTSGDVFGWAYDDALKEFTIKGVPGAWRKYWTAAEKRTEKRVFGWWFAYPWAVLEGTVDTLIRIPVGLCGSAGGAAVAAVGVPAYYMVDSAAVGTWHLGVDAIFLPAVGATWNTLIAPPLSLAGQKPASSRVDGFWVTQLPKEGEATGPVPEVSVSDEEIKVIAEWGHVLLEKSRPYEEKSEDLFQKTQEEMTRINEAWKESEKAIRAEEKAAVSSMAPNGAQKKAMEALKERQTVQTQDEIKTYLAERLQLSPDEVTRVMTLLSLDPPEKETTGKPVRSKADPVLRSIDIIETME